MRHGHELLRGLVLATREGFSARGGPRAPGREHAVLTTLAVGILPFDSIQSSVEKMERDALDSMSEAVLAIAAEREVDPVLRRMVRAARELAGRALRGAGDPRRRGRVRAVHHRRDERRADRGDGPDAAHARPARRDAGVARLLPDDRHPPGPALPRLVAARAPADALVPRRADRGARRDHRRLLPHRLRGRRGVQRRGPAADRDARRPRRGGDRERPPARAQPRAEHRRGAQPARARAARRGQPEAVRRSCSPPSRRRRCSSATPAPPPSRWRGSASSPRRRSRSCAS